MSDDNKLLIKDFLYQKKPLLLNGTKIYLPENDSNLQSEITKIARLEEDNYLLQDTVLQLSDQIKFLQQEIENLKHQDASDEVPSWQDATAAEIQTVLTKFYNDELTKEDIPWKIGDEKHIPYEIQLTSSSFPIYTKEIILTILDCEHDRLATPINGHEYALFTIGIQCIVRQMGKSSSWARYWDGWGDLFSVDNGSSYYCQDAIFYWRKNTELLWTPSRYTDADTTSIFLQFFNPQIITDLFTNSKKEIYFDTPLIQNEARTLIPCPHEFFDVTFEPIGKVYKLFLDNKYNDNFWLPYNRNITLQCTGGIITPTVWRCSDYTKITASNYYNCYSLLIFCI